MTVRCVQVDADHVVPEPHVEASLPVFLGRARDEGLRLHVVVGDEVRKAARGVGRELASFERDNFEFVGRSRGGGPAPPRSSRGITADDDEPSQA